MAGKKIGLVMALDGEKEFKSQVTAVNKSITAMKSELKLVTAEFEGNANSLESLTKKNELYGRILDEQKKKAQEIKNAHDKTEVKYKTMGNKVGALTLEYRKQNDILGQLKVEYAEAQKRLEKMTLEGNSSERSMQKQRGAVESLKKELNAQGDAVNKANDRLADMQTGYRKCGNLLNDWKTKLNRADAEVITARKNLNLYAEYMREAENATDKCATSIDKFGKKIESNDWKPKTMDFLVGGVTEAAAEKGIDAVLNGVEAVKDAMVDSSKASSQLAASTGLSESAAKRYQKVMQQIKGDNFGEDYQDVASAMSEVIQIMGELDDGAMTEVTESAIALRDTFDMDINESIRAVDVMMKTMGVDATTAFDLIATGAQNGLNRSGELVDNITEYAQLWGQAGFSAQEMFVILENGLNSGAYNLDKVNDYVKEFGNSLADGRIEDNLSSFSAQTASLFESWKNGEASTSDVFYSVIKDLSEMTNKQKALTVASEVWSALGEDNAMQVITALDDVNEAYTNVQGTMDELKETKLGDLESSIKNLGSALQERFIAPVVDMITPAIAGMANAAADIIRPAEEKVNQFYEDVISTSETIKQNVESVGAEFSAATEGVDRVSVLGGRLQELNSVEKRTAVQKQEMASIVSELSQSIPELTGAYDSERDALNMTNGELETLISNYRESAAQQAVLAATQELVNQKLEAQVNFDKAQAGKDNAQARIRLLEQERELIGEIQTQQMNGDYSTDYQTEALKLYQEALDQGVITMEEFAEVQEKIAPGQMENRLAAINGEFWDGGEAAGIMHASLAGLGEQSENYNKTMEEQKKILQECDENAETYVNAAKKVHDVQAEIPDELKRGQAAFRDYGESAQESVLSLDEAAKAALGMGESSLSVAEDVEDASSRMSEAAGASAEAQKEAASAQKEAIEEVRDAYKESVSEIEEDLKSKISITDKFDGGEDLTTEKINEILDSNLEGVKRYQENLEKVREMTDESGKALFSPEVMREIEDGGTEYANILQHIVSTWEEQGDYGYEQVKGIADKWGEGLDFSEQTAEAEAANRVAIDAMLHDMGSSDVDFSDLRASIESATENAAEGWQGLPEATQATLQDTVSVAQQIGVTIPEGLADGIASGEISPEQAIEQLNGSIQGRFEGFAEIARSMGISGVDGLAAGISEGGQSAIDAYNTLLQMLSDATAQTGTAGVAQASGDMASAGATAASEKAPEYQTAGEQAAVQYGTGIGTAKMQSIEQARQMAAQAAAAARTYQNAFQNAGYNMALGMASGINLGSKFVADAAARAVRNAKDAANAEADSNSPSRVFRDQVGAYMALGMAEGLLAKQEDVRRASAGLASQALAAAKRELDINSPSKKFRKEVGQNISESTAFGIKDKASLAGKEASKMSAQVYSKATSWINKYRKNHKTTAEDERYFWKEVLKHVKVGTDGYEKALKNYEDLKMKNSFGVSWFSGKGKDRVKKDAAEYYGEVYQAASDNLDKLQEKQNKSIKWQIKYWQDVQKQLRKGTQAYRDAQAEIESLNEKIGTVDNMSDVLSNYKTYWNMSEQAEVEYWDIVRKNFAAGTQERIEADQEYFDAKEQLVDKLKDLEDDYKDKVAEVSEKIADQITDLNKEYEDALKSRTDAIQSAYGLFEEFESESADGKTLLFNIKTQAAGYEDWMKQLDILSGKGILDESLMEQLKEQGPELSATLHALNSLSRDELEEYNDAYLKKLELSQRQAEKDTADLKASVAEQTAQLKAQEQQEKQALLAAYNKNVASVNTHISSEMKTIATNTRQIAEDQTAAIVAAIKEAAGLKTGAEGSTGSNVSQSTMASAGIGSTASSGGTKQNGSSGKEDKILKIINAGPDLKKLSSKEKEEHSPLFVYIQEQYKKQAGKKMYRKLGDALGVKVSDNPKSDEKNDILKKLKKKGYRNGGRGILESVIWMDEELDTVGPELVVSRRDNAILTRIPAGSDVIDARTTDNLIKWGKKSPNAARTALEQHENQLIRKQEELKSYMRTLDYSGVASLNRMLKSGMQVQQLQPTNNEKLERMMENMLAMMERFFPAFAQAPQLNLNGKKMAQELSGDIGAELTLRGRRRRL